MRHRIHMSQFHHTVGQQAQGPTLMPLGRLTTDQGDQMGFRITVQFARPMPSRPRIQRRIQALFHKPSANIGHRRRVNLQSLSYPFVCPARLTLAVVCFQQDAGMSQLARRGPTLTDQSSVSVSAPGIVRVGLWQWFGTFPPIRTDTSAFASAYLSAVNPLALELNSAEYAWTDPGFFQGARVIIEEEEDTLLLALPDEEAQ